MTGNRTKADSDAVHDLHPKDGPIDAHEGAVIERKDNGKVKIVKKHETPTRVGGVSRGTVGLATGLVIALFPAAPRTSFVLGPDLSMGQRPQVVVPAGAWQAATPVASEPVG